MSRPREIRPPEPGGEPAIAAVMDEALATAEAAATRADIVLTEVHDHLGATAAATLLDEVWSRTTGNVLSPEALIAIGHAGGQVTLATRDGELVGVTAGLLGRDHDDGHAFVHSHVTGVAAAATGTGVGRALKWHQRRWCLARGITEVRWTYDPLVRRNAVLNLVHLGAQAIRYEQDVYGPMSDARNAGFPTDRLLVSWDLTSPRTRTAASGRSAAPDVDALRRAGAEPLLSAVDDRPTRHDTDAPRRLVQVPADIESLRREDPDLALAWAAALRSTLGHALGLGLRVSGFSREGWYVLAADRAVDELAQR